MSGGNVSRVYARGGFEILRRDGPYGMHTSVSKQPNRGAIVRASELADGVDRLRVSHTLTNGAGATAIAKASFIESMGSTISFIRDTLSVPDSAARYAIDFRILFPDRVRDLDRLDTWGVLSNVLCVAGGPLRRRLEIESCYGGGKSPHVCKFAATA